MVSAGSRLDLNVETLLRHGLGKNERTMTKHYPKPLEDEAPQTLGQAVLEDFMENQYMDYVPVGMASPRFPLWTPPSSASPPVIPTPLSPRPICNSFAVSHSATGPPSSSLYYHHGPMGPIAPGYPGQLVTAASEVTPGEQAYANSPGQQTLGHPWGYTSLPLLQMKPQQPSEMGGYHTWTNTDPDEVMSLDNTKQYIIDQFIGLLQKYGPQESSSEHVLNLFLSLTTNQRKVVMKSGSVKAFLQDEGVIRLEKNTMKLIGRFLTAQTEEDNIERDELDEQQLLFEQKASSHGIHISSPSPSYRHSESIPDAQNDPYNPYFETTASWDTSLAPYGLSQQQHNMEQTMSSKALWSADDDQSLSFLHENENMLCGFISQMGEETEEPLNDGNLDRSDEQVNISIQRLQREIVYHQGITEMANQLVNHALEQAQRTLVEVYSCGGDGIDTDVGNGGCDMCVGNKGSDTGVGKRQKDATYLNSSCKQQISHTCDDLLPSFVPKFNQSVNGALAVPKDTVLFPTATVTTSHSIQQKNTSTSQSYLSATAQVFTPRYCSAPSRNTVYTDTPNVLDKATLPKQRLPYVITHESMHQSTQTLLTTVHRGEKSTATNTVKKQHIGLQMDGPTSVMNMSTDKATMTGITVRNRRLQVGYPRVFVEFCEAHTSTDPVEEDDLVDTIDGLQYDEMVARAAAAEETLVLTQCELHMNKGLGLLKELERTFTLLSSAKQQALGDRYAEVRRDINDQVSRIQQLAEQNIMAIRDGAWMNSLPILSWEAPEIPLELLQPNTLVTQETKRREISADSQPQRKEEVASARAEDTTPNESIPQQSEEKSHDEKEQGQMDFIGPLLQQMMLSLARMNPALSMQPHLLQATAMQHLASMQRAGMVPNMVFPRQPTSSNPNTPDLQVHPSANVQSRLLQHHAAVPTPISNSAMSMLPNISTCPDIKHMQVLAGSADGDFTTTPINSVSQPVETHIEHQPRLFDVNPTLEPCTKDQDKLYQNTPVIAQAYPTDIPRKCPTRDMQSYSAHITQSTVLPNVADTMSNNPSNDQVVGALVSTSPYTDPIEKSDLPVMPVTEDWEDDLDLECHDPKLTTGTCNVPQPIQVSEGLNGMRNATTMSSAVKRLPVQIASDTTARISTEPRGKTDNNRSRKPLPVIASSIKSVPVNQPGIFKPPAAPALASGKSERIPRDFETSKIKGTTKWDRETRGIQYDDTNNNTGGVAGLSDFTTDDCYEEESSDSWQEGSKRRKKRKVKPLSSEEKEDGGFDKLIAQMMLKFPHLSRTEVVKVIMEIRSNHGTLRGIKAEDILADAQLVIKRKSGVQCVQENKVAGSLLYKTSICEYWKAGTCVSGDKCVYAHGKADLRPPPKHIMCANWKKNRQCPHKEKCIFAHGEKELQKGQQALGQLKKDDKVDVKKGPVPSYPASWAPSAKEMRAANNNMVDVEEDEDSHNNNQGYRDTTCVICHDRISASRVKKLECGHKFHNNCIMRWIEGEERTCPTCRRHALLVEDYPMLG